MASKPRWLIGLVLGSVLWGSLSQAQEALTWQFPRDFSPQPASFRITYRNSNDPGGVLQQLGVPWHPLEACASLPASDTPSPDTFCTVLPDCLAPGIYTFWAQAIWPDATSGESNLLTCQATAPCTCTAIALPDVPPSPSPTPPTSPVVPPLVPLTPVVTTPPVEAPPPVFQFPPTAPA